ncbi:uncharacterized protein METZ01_LOCUS516508, partial [marine metagenome]
MFLNSSDNFSIIGFKTLQGPHQEAENCKIDISSFLTFEL